MKKRDRNTAASFRRIENKKLVLMVYLVLRILVIITMFLQILEGNYENVYICLLTLILFFIPSLVERRLHVDLPDALEIIILIFIFAAEILGEIQEYYLSVPFWDTVLHTINGFLFAAIGFSIVNLLNQNKRVSMTLSPFYMAVTAFCFSMTIGVLWEFFEFGMDQLFLTDMQKDVVIHQFSTVLLDPTNSNLAIPVTGITDTAINGESLGLGGYLDIGLVDTMKDLLVNFIGAVVFSVIGFFYVKSRGRNRFATHFIPVVKIEEDTGEDQKNIEK